MIIENISFDGSLLLIFSIAILIIWLCSESTRGYIMAILLLWGIASIPSKKILLVEYSDIQKTYLYQVLRVYGSPTIDLIEGETLNLDDYKLKNCKSYILNATDAPLYLLSYEYRSSGYLEENKMRRITIQNDSVAAVRMIPDYIFKEPELKIKGLFMNPIQKRQTRRVLLSCVDD